MTLLRRGLGIHDARADVLRWSPGRAANAAVEWQVVELDRCATDMFTAVEQSYTYLVSNGLVRGRA